MDPIAKPMDITIYPPEVQGTGEFDGGRITEIKPLGFFVPEGVFWFL